MLNLLPTRKARLIRSARGGVMVELGIAAPLVMALCLAAGDFARIFYHAMTAQAAAGQAAFYGVQTTGQTGDFAGMEARAYNDKGPLAAPEITASQWCGCPDGASFSCAEYSVQTCSGYGDPLAYVRVEVREDFETFAKYFLIPQKSTVRQEAWMRVR